MASNAKTNLVNRFIPAAGENEEKELFVGLNGVGYRIKRGTTVTVPAGVAAILDSADMARAANEEFLDAQAAKLAGM